MYLMVFVLSGELPSLPYSAELSRTKSARPKEQRPTAQAWEQSPCEFLAHCQNQSLLNLLTVLEQALLGQTNNNPTALVDWIHSQNEEDFVFRLKCEGGLNVCCFRAIPGKLSIITRPVLRLRARFHHFGLKAWRSLTKLGDTYVISLGKSSRPDLSSSFFYLKRLEVLTVKALELGQNSMLSSKGADLKFISHEGHTRGAENRYRYAQRDASIYRPHGIVGLQVRYTMSLASALGLATPRGFLIKGIFLILNGPFTSTLLLECARFISLSLLQPELYLVFLEFVLESQTARPNRMLRQLLACSSQWGCIREAFYEEALNQKLIL